MMSDSPFNPELDLTCEAVVLEFEKSRRAGRPFNLADTLNYIEPSQRSRLAAELACIDLEHCCDEGRLPAVSAIVWEFPALFESDAARTVVALEHFRLCCILGTPIGREAIAKRYNIAPSELPDRTSAQAGPIHARDVLFPAVGTIFCNYPLIAELGRGDGGRRNPAFTTCIHE